MGSQRKHKHLLEHNTRSSTQTTNTTGQQLHNIKKKTHTLTSKTLQVPSTNSSLTQFLTKHHKQEKNKENTQIHITTEEVQAANKSSKNNNSTGPDNLNIKHLKHIGKLGLIYLTNIIIQRCTQRQQNISCMEIGHHHTYPQT